MYIKLEVFRGVGGFLGILDEVSRIYMGLLECVCDTGGLEVVRTGGGLGNVEERTWKYEGCCNLLSSCSYGILKVSAKLKATGIFLEVWCV